MTTRNPHVSSMDGWESFRKPEPSSSGSPADSGQHETTESVQSRSPKEKLFDSIFGISASDTPTEPEEIGQFCNGRYKIESLFDEGGLGALYLAHDTELGRLVIVKGIRPERANDFASQRQFVNEAAITGQLEHPGIVPIYGFGRDEHRRPYYAMHMIRGTKLGEVIRHFHSQGIGTSEQVKTFNRLLENFRSVCLTIHYAHSRNVIHRDIKPDNIMLGKFGEVLVIDWGLAKQIARPAQTSPREDDDLSENHDLDPIDIPSVFQTRQGSVKGSPMYMSPEQSEGSTEQIGIASDVYGLGATLYELLSGRPPFEGSSVDVIAQVKSGQIRPPRQIAPQLAPALEAICLKAMQHRPDDRYRTAKELADDIENYLADEPVIAYAEPWFDSVRRWARHHRTLVTSAVLTMLIGIFALATISALLTKHNGELIVAKKEADKAKEAEQKRAEELEQSLYVNQMMVAQAAWKGMDLPRTVDVLDSTKPELRSLEWSYANQLSHQSTALPWYAVRPMGLQTISRLVTSADGKWLMSEERGPKPGTAELVDSTHVIASDTGAPKLGMGAGFLAFDTTGTHVLRRERADNSQDLKSYRLSLVEIRTGASVWQTEPIKDESGGLFVASFIDSQTMPNRTDRQESAAEATNRASQEFVIMTDVLRMSAELQTRYRVAHFEFRSAQSGQIIRTVDSGPIIGERAIFSPNGRRVAIMDVLGVEVLDVDTGKSLSKLSIDTGHFFCNVVLNWNGALIATSGADRAVRIWSSSDGHELVVLRGMSKRALCLAFSHAGNLIAAAGEQGGIHIWDIASAELIRALPSHDVATYTVTFSRDDSLIYAGGTDGFVRQFKLDKPAVANAIHQPELVTKVRLSPNGETIAAIVGIGRSSKLRAYERSTGQLRFEMKLYDPQRPSAALFVSDVAYTPDGSSLAICGDQMLRLVDARDGKERWQIEGCEGPLTITPDGRSLLALRKRRYFIEVIKNDGLSDQIRGEQATNVIRDALRDGQEQVFFHDSGDAKLLRLLEQDQANADLIATIKDRARSAHVTIETSTGKLHRVHGYQADFDNHIVMHPTRSVIAIAEKGKVVLREVESDKAVNEIPLTTSLNTRLAFSPDGSRLMVISVIENSAAIFDVQSGKLVLTLAGNDDAIREAVFTPDGNRIVTSSVNGQLRIWDAATASLLWSIEETKLPINSIGLSNDGRQMVAGSGSPKSESGGDILAWNLSSTRDGSARLKHANVTDAVSQGQTGLDSK